MISMRKSWRNLLVIASMLVVVFGFASQIPVTASEGEEAFLQVAHLAPFAEDASVTVNLNGADALIDFNYGDSTEYIALPAGEYQVAVIPTGATDAAIEATVELMADTYYTTVAVGDGVNQDLDLILLEDDLTLPAEGTFHLRLGHLAPFAAGPATADIRLQDGTPVLLDVNFNVVTDFLPLPAGEYDLKITTPGGETTLIDPLPVDFAEGTIISAFATGEGANQDLGVFALPADAEGFFLDMTTYLQVAHLASFAEDASVTVTLNGADALTDFNYGDSTGYIALPAGEYDVAVIPTGATDAAIEATVELMANNYYTVIAAGDITNQDLGLILLVDDLTAPAEGTFHLRLGHMASFASGDDVLADVRLQDGTPVLENVAFGIVSGYLPLPAGEYDLKITTPDGETTLIDPLPVSFTEGMIISAFASGEGVNQDLGIFALPAGEEGFFLPLAQEFKLYMPLVMKNYPAFAYLQVVHLAPFAEDASVTVTLNGEAALTDFNYGDSTAYISLPVGEYDVAVIPTGSTDAAIEATVTLLADTYYTVIAVGDITNQELGFIMLVDDLTAPAEGTFHLRLGHLAPFASGEAVLADVRLQDGTPVLENVDFGDVTAFLPLPVGEYDLKITTPGGETTLIDPLPVYFTEGMILSAFASGEGVNQDLGVFALPAGVEGFFLPLDGVQ
jgi:hypothetical protein